MKLIYQRKREDDLADYADRLLQGTNFVDRAASFAASSDQQLVQSLCIFLRASLPEPVMQRRIQERLRDEWRRLPRRPSRAFITMQFDDRF